MKLTKILKLEQAVFSPSDDEVELTEEEELEKQLCEASFYEFVKTFWFEIAQCSYRDGWHVEAFCDHLQTMHMGGFNDLIYNGPFRSGKSNVLAVALPAWVWIDDPTESFLYSAYKMALSERDSKACNALIKSPKYQKYWGHYVKVDKRYDNVLSMQLTEGGVRRITSIARPTGFGANWIICFPWYSLVATDKGDLPIGKIVDEAIECKVASYNHDINEVEYQSILSYFKNPSPPEMIEIELEDGRLIECTPNHPIWIEERGYINAQDLQVGETVLCLD